MSFEDQFMEIQSGLIALCMEVTEEKVDKVFAYVSIEKDSQSFNAFFERDGKILTLNELGIPDGLMMQFLELGTEDLDKIRQLCESEKIAVPTEMKMYFDAKTNQYHADYRYAEEGEESVGAGEGFVAWLREYRR